MSEEILPRVRVLGPANSGFCAIPGCGASEFDTEHGRGSVFQSDPFGQQMRFQGPSGPTIENGVTCSNGHLNAPVSEFDRYFKSDITADE